MKKKLWFGIAVLSLVIMLAAEAFFGYRLIRHEEEERLRVLDEVDFLK